MLPTGFKPDRIEYQGVTPDISCQFLCHKCGR
jgi:hypothetical protein